MGTLLGEVKFTLLDVCILCWKKLSLQSLNILFQTCFWRWQGRATVFHKLAENDGTLIWDSDDSDYDDSAKSVYIFGIDQYANQKILSSFVLLNACPNLLADFLQVVYVKEVPLILLREASPNLCFRANHIY